MESKWTSRAAGEVHFCFYRLLGAMDRPHPLRLDLGAVLHGGDAVQLVEGFQEAAVVREAVLGAGGEDALAVGDVLAAALHPQLGQVVVDALLGVLLKDAGQVLTADVGVLGQFGHRQVGGSR